MGLKTPLCGVLFLALAERAVGETTIAKATFNKDIKGSVVVNGDSMTVQLDLSSVGERSELASCFTSEISVNIYEKWTPSDEKATMGVGGQCGTNHVGFRWDPTLACSAQSGGDFCKSSANSAPEHCVTGSSALGGQAYNCTPEIYKVNPWACEVGDFGGKFGKITLVERQAFKKFVDAYMPPPSTLQGTSVLIECKTTSICANFNITTTQDEIFSAPAPDYAGTLKAEFTEGGVTGHVTIGADHSFIVNVDYDKIDKSKLPGGEACLKNGLKFAIHDKWTATKNCAFGAECTAEVNGLRYDPTLACSKYSANPFCAVNKGCVLGSTANGVTTYACTEQLYRTNPYTCEVGDIGSRAPGMIQSKANFSFYDALIPPLDDMTGRSIVFHCGGKEDNMEPVFCAKLNPVCAMGCVKCTNTATCTECAPHFTMKEATCRCKDSTYLAQNGTCLPWSTCKPGTYADGGDDLTDIECRDCGQHCSDCTATKCLSCLQNFELREGECECNPPFTLKDGACLAPGQSPPNATASATPTSTTSRTPPIMLPAQTSTSNQSQSATPTPTASSASQTPSSTPTQNSEQSSSNSTEGQGEELDMEADLVGEFGTPLKGSIVIDNEGMISFKLDLSEVKSKAPADWPVQQCLTKPITYWLASSWSAEGKTFILESGKGECSQGAVGARYDLAGACSPLSDNDQCEGCITKYGNTSKYACTPTAYAQNPYSCDTGDLSGKFGDITYSNPISISQTDRFLPPTIVLHGSSVVLECGGVKVACAQMNSVSKKSNTTQKSEVAVSGKPPVEQRKQREAVEQPDALMAVFDSSGKMGSAVIKFKTIAITINPDVFPGDVPEACKSDVFDWLITDQWTGGNGSFAFDGDCGNLADLGVYDPTLACGPNTGNPLCKTYNGTNKMPKDQACMPPGVAVNRDDYMCDPDVFKIRPYGCMIGDLVNRHGAASIDSENKTQEWTFTDRYLPPLTMLANRGIVMRCGDGEERRTVCALLKPTKESELEAKPVDNKCGYMCTECNATECTQCANTYVPDKTGAGCECASGYTDTGEICMKNEDGTKKQNISGYEPEVLALYGVLGDGTLGYVRIPVRGSADGHNLDVFLNFSNLPVSTTDVELCKGRPISWYITDKWENEASFQLGVEDSQATNRCGPNWVGGQYDPAAACSPTSGNEYCHECGYKRRTGKYECTPEVYSKTPYSCEVGDLTGKFGALLLDEKLVVNKSFTAPYLPVNALEGKAIVFSCQNKPAFCMKLQTKPSTQVYLPSKRQAEPTVPSRARRGTTIQRVVGTFSEGNATGNITIDQGKITLNLEKMGDTYQEFQKNCKGSLDIALHEFWREDKLTSGYGKAQCGVKVVGDRWDPTAACSDKTNNVFCKAQMGCMPGSSAAGHTIYTCTPALSNSNPYTCEVGDLSGRFGPLAINGTASSGKGSKEMLDVHMVPVANYKDLSVVLSCPSMSESFYLCAKLQLVDAEVDLTCNTNCKECKDNGCHRCSETFLLVNGDCVCAPNHKLQDGKCVPEVCDPYCVQCQNTTCNQCLKGFILSGGRCICSEDMYINGTECVDCRACADNQYEKASCSYIADTVCTACPKAAYCSVESTYCTAPDNPQCKRGHCDEGYYNSMDTAHSLCSKCPPECTSCSDFKTCTKCQDGFDLQSNACNCRDPEKCKKFVDVSMHPNSTKQSAPNCPVNCDTCTNSSTCTECSAGFAVMTTGGCIECLPNCLQCSHPSNCTQCAPSFVRHPTGSCVCPNSSFLDHHVCISCRTNCEECTTLKSCKKCKPTFTDVNHDGACECQEQIEYYEAKSNTCKAITTCDPRRQYQITGPSSTTDRVCQCRPEFYGLNCELTETEKLKALTKAEFRAVSLKQFNEQGFKQGVADSLNAMQRRLNSGRVRRTPTTCRQYQSKDVRVSEKYKTDQGMEAYFYVIHPCDQTPLEAYVVKDAMNPNMQVITLLATNQEDVKASINPVTPDSDDNTTLVIVAAVISGVLGIVLLVGTIYIYQRCSDNSDEDGVSKPIARSRTSIQGVDPGSGIEMMSRPANGRSIDSTNTASAIMTVPASGLDGVPGANRHIYDTSTPIDHTDGGIL